jgi:hypothetical protein
MADSAKGAKPGIWNSLEICKLMVAAATPILCVLLGGLLWLTQRDIVQHWERDQQEKFRFADAKIKESDKIRDFRLALYREAAPLLNEIVSYHFYVGRWKERSPADIIDKKRQLDTLLYSNRPLFSAEFVGLYHNFMRQAFRGAREFHGESRLRTPCAERHRRPIVGLLYGRGYAQRPLHSIHRPPGASFRGAPAAVSESL